MGYTATDALGAPPREFLEVWLVPKKFAALAFKRRMVEDQVAHNAIVNGDVALKKQLGWFSFACMGVGSIIATGIFSFMPQIYASITGPAVMLSLLVASVAAGMSALIYSEFAVEYPMVGGGFVYVLNVFGEFPAVLCATNLVLDYVFGNAAVVRNFSVYFSELMNKNVDIFQMKVSFQTDDVDYLALIIVLFLTGVAIWSTKVFDEGNMVLQVFHVGLVVFTFVAAFTKADTRNWTPFFPDILVPSGPRTIVTGASHIFFVFIGYDVIALGAEEAKSNLSVPIGMLGSVVFVTIIYMLMAASLVMLYPFALLNNKPANMKIAGFAYAFTQRGLTWCKYIVAMSACIGIFTHTGIGIYGLSRIFTVFAREGMVPAAVGHVNSHTITPILAVVLSGLVSGSMAFFTRFDTLANMTSIGTLTMYWFVAIAYIYRRYAPEFEAKHGDRHLSIPFRPDLFGGLSVTARRIIILAYIFMITAAPVGFAIYWNLSNGSWALGMTAAMWFVFTLLLQLTMPINYVPEKFALPWWSLPWVPSVSIWANIMLVGGFGASVADYYRLGAAMAIGAGIYLLYGVHASYYRFYRGGQEAEGVAVQEKAAEEEEY